VISDGGYHALVPCVDADGNDLGGIRPTAVAAPMGTYTGWNLRRAGFGETSFAGLTARSYRWRRQRPSARALTIPASPSKNGMRPTRDTLPPSAERRSSCKLAAFFWKKMLR
jgi:hypothetical protein